MSMVKSLIKLEKLVVSSIRPCLCIIREISKNKFLLSLLIFKNKLFLKNQKSIGKEIVL